jgi:hypothetical protein
MRDARGGWRLGGGSSSVLPHRAGPAGHDGVWLRVSTADGGTTRRHLMARWRRMALGPGAGEQRAIARDDVAIVLFDSPGAGALSPARGA